MSGNTDGVLRPLGLIPLQSVRFDLRTLANVHIAWGRRPTTHNASLYHHPQRKREERHSRDGFSLCGRTLLRDNLSSCPGLGTRDVDDSVVNAAPPGSVGKASCIFKSLFPGASSVFRRRSCSPSACMIVFCAGNKI